MHCFVGSLMQKKCVPNRKDPGPRIMAWKAPSKCDKPTSCGRLHHIQHRLSDYCSFWTPRSLIESPIWGCPKLRYRVLVYKSTGLSSFFLSKQRFAGIHPFQTHPYMMVLAILVKIFHHPMIPPLLFVKFHICWLLSIPSYRCCWLSLLWATSTIYLWLVKNHHKPKFFESLDSTSWSSWDLNVVPLYCLVNGICNWLQWSPICWKITCHIPQKKTPIIMYQFIFTDFPVCDVYPIH